MVLVQPLGRRYAWVGGGDARPPKRPRARAAARSRARRHSNCARLEKRLNINSPKAVVVPMARPVATGNRCPFREVPPPVPPGSKSSVPGDPGVRRPVCPLAPARRHTHPTRAGCCEIRTPCPYRYQRYRIPPSSWHPAAAASARYRCTPGCSRSAFPCRPPTCPVNQRTKWVVDIIIGETVNWNRHQAVSGGNWGPQQAYCQTVEN